MQGRDEKGCQEPFLEIQPGVCKMREVKKGS
jgi:hypothetical protein